MTPIRLMSGLSGLLACLALASCASTKDPNTTASNEDEVVDYTKDNYAFDSKGNYREDWVAAREGVSGVKDKPVASESPYVQEPYESSAPTVAVRSSSSSSTPRTSTSSRSSSSGSSSGSSSRSTASRSKPKPKPKPKPSLVTVKSGDTLYNLSKRHGVSIASIKEANGLKSDLIIDGKSLKIPKKL